MRGLELKASEVLCEDGMGSVTAAILIDKYEQPHILKKLCAKYFISSGNFQMLMQSG